MADILNRALDAPVANILILAGLAFLAVGVIGKISGKIEPGTGGRLMSGVLGIALLSYGLYAHSGSGAAFDGVDGPSDSTEVTEPTPTPSPDDPVDPRDDPPDPAAIVVPDLRGQPYVEATERLESAGMAVTLRTEQPGPGGLPRGRVLDTDPPAGSSLPAGASVTLVVSSGSTSPDLGGIQEDCLSFTTANVRLSRDGSGWLLSDGSSRMLTFDSQQEGERALAIIRNYGMDAHCFVGRPDASVQYWLANRQPPTGAMAGEDCLGFDPENLDVISTGGRWFLADGSSRMVVFPDEAEAREARTILRGRGFTEMCYVGRPDPSFTYFRR